MTVRELIAELKKHDGDELVVKGCSKCDQHESPNGVWLRQFDTIKGPSVEVQWPPYPVVVLY